MKIGIVTQPLQGNYGGILQNYAMQQVLLRLGHEPVTLDFLPAFKGGWRLWLRTCVVSIVRRLRGEGNPIFFHRNAKRRHRPTIDFLRKHIKISKTFSKCYPSNLVNNLGLEALVVGSDQVWRPCYNQSQADMFLRFSGEEKVKRVAYAASFGTAEWEFTDMELAEECGALLKKFDAISVRERSGIELAARLGRADAREVIDPTLLLGRAGFDSIVTPYAGKPSGAYLGAYILDRNEAITRHLESLAAEMGLTSVLQFQAMAPGMGPGHWIDAIKSSRLFIADSFHGTVFCLLYHVPFIALCNAERGADRFHSLLSPLGLDYALVNNISDITPERLRSLSFDWEDIDRRIESQRQSSLRFLQDALQS